MTATRRACAAILVACGLLQVSSAQAQLARLTDRDVIDAYHYMLGRWLVLRQETLDLKESFKWNQVVHREPGGPGAANPNLDVALSEAWVAVDETSCTLIELPEIKGRYYTVQVLNGWAEVTANINERNYPKHPSGKFALCLKDTKLPLPKGTRRVDVPSRKSRMLVRIELGASPADAVALQKKIAMKATGSPKIDKAVVELTFGNDKLPGAEGFEKTEEILASEADINRGMVGVQEKAIAVAKAIADPAERARIDEAIRKRAIPAFLAAIPKMGKAVNGWIQPRAAGNWGSDYQMRSIASFTGIWANNSKETVYFVGQGLDGSLTYIQTHPADALPGSKASYFWSVAAVDGDRLQVISNPLNRHALNSKSALKPNADGSLTLAFGPRQPEGVPESNWLPTPAGKRYNLTYRFYGPAKEVAGGTYHPPPLVRK
jgi:hypothetical protein